MPVSEGRCGLRRWPHALWRWFDLDTIRERERAECTSLWVPYAIAKWRVRRFDDMTRFSGRAHWRCACGEPVRIAERLERMDQVYRAQVSR
jgi:hypothetical protein